MHKAKVGRDGARPSLELPNRIFKTAANEPVFRD
jgi:hypothetical protein